MLKTKLFIILRKVGKNAKFRFTSAIYMLSRNTAFLNEKTYISSYFNSSINIPYSYNPDKKYSEIWVPSDTNYNLRMNSSILYFFECFQK